MTPQREGFSLFEVLIAFAILSLVLGALIPGQAQLLTRATNSDTQALAQEYALSRSAALGILSPLQLGTKEGIYRDWTITEETIQVLRLDTGQVVETRIEIFNADGSSICLLYTSPSPRDRG